MPKSKFSAIFQQKCPRCREGNIFKYTLLQKPFSPLATHKECPECGFRFEIEPGFFWGALYISYAMMVAVMVSVIVAIVILFDTREPLHYIIPTVSLMLLIYPFALRYARVLLITFFSGTKYHENWREVVESKRNS